jgi:hypothetical protein
VFLMSAAAGISGRAFFMDDVGSLGLHLRAQRPCAPLDQAKSEPFHRHQGPLEITRTGGPGKFPSNAAWGANAKLIFVNES